MSLSIQQPGPMLEHGNLAVNWREWKTSFEYYLIASGSDKKPCREKCALFLHIIGKYGREIYEEFDLDAESLQYDQLLKKFQERCDPTLNVNYERHVYFETYQNGDTFDKFISHIRIRSKSCEFGTLRDSMILTQIIRGLKDSQMREKMLAKTKLKLEDAIAWCRTAERASQQAAVCSGGGGALHGGAAAVELEEMARGAASRGSGGPRRRGRGGRGRRPGASALAGGSGVQCGARGGGAAGPSRTPSSVCGRCSGWHGAGDRCPAYNVKCYRCDRFGHFSKCCNVRVVNELADDHGDHREDMDSGPGMNKTTTLSEKTKESLSVVVIKPTSGGFFESFMAEKRCSLSVEGANCTAAHINLFKKKTQVVISGYLDSASSPLVRAIVQPYLDRGRNVIVVEIFPLLVRTYPLAARVTRPFGTLLGEYLAALMHLGLSPGRLELLGGSLGAHIASYASVRFFELTGRRPARITGLDPAGPCFRNLPYSERLNRHAALRVDVLHTNIDGFGIADPLGHVDFYANGGEFQQSMKKGFLMPCLALCSHVRAALYWIKACLHPEDFQAVRCGSVADARHGACYDTNVSNLLGPKTDFTKPGIYFLPTNEYPPYYRGTDGLKRRSIGVNTYLLQVAPDDDVTI